jgi:hypothetical protein
MPCIVLKSILYYTRTSHLIKLSIVLTFMLYYTLYCIMLCTVLTLYCIILSAEFTLYFIKLSTRYIKVYCLYCFLFNDAISTSICTA